MRNFNIMKKNEVKTMKMIQIIWTIIETHRENKNEFSETDKKQNGDW